ncbi:MAG: ACP S-malonyltransferase [Planctomycetes bacterium]|nr:ACP S-malonyltransferase [Planctomycetota bacterium]
MRAIMADNDVKGQVAILAKLLEAEPWREFWLSLNLPLWTFADVPLAVDASDAAVWHACQREQVILITGNRNKKGLDSLEATIQKHNTAPSLPVMTIADPDEVIFNRPYAHKVVEALLQYLLEIDKVRGTGRLWLP